MVFLHSFDTLSQQFLLGSVFHAVPLNLEVGYLNPERPLLILQAPLPLSVLFDGHWVIIITSIAAIASRIGAVVFASAYRSSSVAASIGLKGNKLIGFL